MSDEIKRAVREIFDEEFYRHGIHTGGSYGVEYDSDQQDEMLERIAKRVAAKLETPDATDAISVPLSADDFDLLERALAIQAQHQPNMTAIAELRDRLKRTRVRT